MNKYQHGKIYRLVNAVNDDVYVGSTCLPLHKRISCHRALSKKKDSRVYAALNEVGWEVVSIELIEAFACENSEELRRREQHHIELIKPNLNLNAAYHSFRCEHGKIKNQCVPCGGLSMCEHGRQRWACVVCSPVSCGACGATFSKGSYSYHVKTAKHLAAMAIAAN